jgi:LysR family transcriptional regulator, transcriptional activator of the cysJI operon
MNEALRVFLAVTDHGSFTKAADALHLTQPAVSQHIRSLERDLGAHLMERNNRIIRLTKAGEIVREHARLIIQTEAEMRHRVSELSTTVMGTLYVGASYSIGEYMLPVFLADFCKAYPGVEPKIEIGNTTSIAERVAARELDVGLVEGTNRRKEVETQILGTDQLILVGAPDNPLTDRTVVSETEIRDTCWILREEGSGLREVSDYILTEYGIHPARTMTFSSTQAIKEAVKSGIGISVLSLWSLQSELKLGTLRAINLIGMPVTRYLSILLPATMYQSKVANTFASFTKDNFAQWAQKYTGRVRK